MILDETRSADALAFLRASLTPAEQQWPRFTPALRAVRDVSIGELRTHPDLVERIIEIAPTREHVWMLMGAPVLVTPSGVVYGIGFGMRTFALHAGGAVVGFQRVQTNTPRSTGGGVLVLNEEWIAVDPFMPKAKLADGIAKLKELVSAAFAFVDR
jgi:hypothetical protein